MIKVIIPNKNCYKLAIELAYLYAELSNFPNIELNENPENFNINDTLIIDSDKKTIRLSLSEMTEPDEVTSFEHFIGFFDEELLKTKIKEKNALNNYVEVIEYLFPDISDL